MIDTNEKQYIAELATVIFGSCPKDVVASQLNLGSAQIVNKKFFVLAYSTGASDYITFTCNSVSTETRIGTVAGVDALSYIMCDTIVNSGAAIISGYELIY